MSDSSSAASVRAVPASATATEPEALDAYLADYSTGKPTSFLEVALRDARAALAADPPPLWLASLGYLVIVEQLGATVRLASAAP